LSSFIQYNLDADRERGGALERKQAGEIRDATGEVEPGGAQAGAERRCFAVIAAISHCQVPAQSRRYDKLSHLRFPLRLDKTVVVWQEAFHGIFHLVKRMKFGSNEAASIVVSKLW